MTTETEEIQVKEFLKRAEVKTMKKDLKNLREFDALKEKDKIAKLKTVEEEQIELAKKQEAIKQKAQQDGEKQKREEVLGKNILKEREAEKDLKKYASEGEKQQIFLLEAQRIDIENQIKLIENEKDPFLARQKNKILSEIKVQEIKLKDIIEGEKKFEDEQKYIEEKESQSNIASEKKGLEERRSELENQRQEQEKKRWQAEKDLAELKNKIEEIDKNLETNFTQKNNLNNKIKEIDNSLRTIYSGVMASEEEKRRGQQDEQKISDAKKAKTHAETNERIQREQWRGDSFEAEEEQRTKFIKNIEEQTKI